MDIIVEIIDIDFTHSTFKDTYGNLKISKVYESGTSHTNYNYESEYIAKKQALTNLCSINGNLIVNSGY